MARLLARSGSETGSVFDLSKEVTTIGRNPTNDLVLGDDRVSRLHARIKRRGELYEVEDLKSTHGTFVNGALIAGEQALKDTDLLRFGHTEFLFKAGVSPRLTEDTVPTFVGNGLVQAAADDEMAAYLDSAAIRVPNAPSPENANLSGWRLDVLAQVADTLQSATSEEDFLEALMDVLFDAFKPDRGVIFLSREPGGTLVRRLARPDLAETSVSKSILHYAVTRQMSLMVPDIVEDERFQKVSSVLQHSIRGALCGPLVHKGRILGAVYLDRRVEPFEDNRENLILLNIIATHTAITLENAMLAQAEKAKEERFRIVAETVSDVIYEWDLKDKVDWYGDVDGLLGYPAGGFPRTLAGWAAALHPEDKERVWAAVDGQIKGVAPYNVEYRLAGKDGRWRWWSARGVLLRDQRGEPKRWLGAVTDITERKRAEEALRESEAKYRTLVENIPQKVFMKDRDSRWVSINEKFARDLGIRPEDAAGKTDFDFFPEEMAEKFRAADKRIVETGQTEEVEERYLEKDRETWVQTIRTPIRGISGEVIGVLGVFWDITERKRIEDQLRQAQKMDAVGRLAGGVAHDFNNMLQVILMGADMALREAAPDSPLGQNLLEIKKAGQRSADLTRQLLAFARKQTIAPRVLDLNDTVAGMLKMLGRLIGEDIDLLWKPCRDLHAVKMDPGQIDQILANLCVNARDAIAGVGKVTIETGKEEFDQAYCDTHPGFRPGQYVMLGVSDDGCGMDKATLANIFEPFFTTKESGEGTGLGLATVYGIVKQNNGFINVYSEPGKGTTFRIYLPPHEAKAAAGGKKRESLEPATGTETVLLVEDQEALLTLCRRLLERLGYTVLAAGSPQEAIRLVEEHKGDIHLLITDIVMPEMSGGDLWGRLNALRPGLKSLFMSGYTANVIAHRAILEEGVHFLQKPFSVEALAAKVREALSA
jgi:PAS domain S-box-containing protein